MPTPKKTVNKATKKPAKKPARKPKKKPSHYRLRPDHERFAAAYVGNGGNATAATKQIWPQLDRPNDTVARNKANRLLTNANIQLRIRQLSANKGMTVDKALDHLHTRMSIEDNQQLKALDMWFGLTGYSQQQAREDRGDGPTINLIGNDALDRLRQVAESRLSPEKSHESHVEQRSTDDLGIESTDAEIVDERGNRGPKGREGS